MEHLRWPMESHIFEFITFYSEILLIGPQQAGKTTMLRYLAEK